MDNIVTKFLSRHPLYLIFLTILLTAFFSYVASSDNSIDEVSFDTGGKIFELNKKIGENFQSPYHFTSVILESRSEDIFTPQAFSEILNNQNKLIALDNNFFLSKAAGINEDNYLFNLTDFETGRKSTGVTSIVDITDEFIKTQMNIPDGVNGVNKNQLKFALDKILASEQGNELLRTISRDDVYTKVKHVSNELGEYNEWSSKALLVNVILDNEKLGGGTFNVGLGADQNTLNKEYLGREITNVLAGTENNYKLWPIAVDVNLYSQEQGETSGVYLTLTVIVAILIAGLSLRSFYTVSIIGFGISALILWLKGISFILGIKGGLIVDFIVPIAMVSLGVDFAIHAIRRYQESKISHPENMTKALSFGLAAVSGALILAVLSDSLAFLSNAVTGIESLMHFGFSAAIATFSSFFLLGIIAPIVYMQTDKWLIQYNQNTRHINPILKIFAGVLAACTAGVSVILTVAINPGYGGLVLAGYILIFLVLPIIYLKIFGSIGQIVKEEEKFPSRKRIFQINFNPVTLFTNLTNYRYIVIFVTIIITMYSGYYALKLKPTFDVKDFFDPNSEFVIGLDKMDEYFSDSAGEPAEIYFEGRLDSLKFINTLNSFTLTLDENKYVGQDLDGSTQYYEFTVLHLMETILSNDFAKNIYSTHPEGTKKNITDNDNNLIFDDDNQISSLFKLAPKIGIPKSNTEFLIPPQTINNFLRYDVNNDSYSMRLQFGLLKTNDFESILNAFDILSNDVKIFENYGENLVDYGITGSPFIREAQTSAATDSLRQSIPVAALGALILLLLATRSFYYSFVTVFPLLLIVSWLYALMYFLGFGLNFVTATIGAVSIGVGLDFSIHMTERFRQEININDDPNIAISISLKGTGLALIGAGVSSIAGFIILGFAPMPLFSTYGILSAAMISFALIASITVVPSLLLIVIDIKKKLKFK
ncbi:MAG: hypothetical protein FI681_03080 [SAR202 cluster bacterium]|nr:hypothetical protein [SAR202 cluster bacterium]